MANHETLIQGNSAFGVNLMFTYEINIARHSQPTGWAEHFGRLVLDAGISEADAKEDFAIACERFTADDGFSLALYSVPVASRQPIAYSEGA